MKISKRAGLLLLPFTALVGLLVFGVAIPWLEPGRALLPGPTLAGLRLAADRPCEADQPCAQLEEMEVQDVIPLEEANAHAVVLVSKRDGTVLPIFVDEGAALAIAFRLAEREAPEPQAQDLLDEMVAQLGGEVTEVRIDSLRGEVLGGRIFLLQGERKLEVEARPSESISMALTRGAKIFASKEVLAQAGITREEIESLREELGIGGSGPPALEEPGQLPPGHPPVPGGDGSEIQL